MKNFVITAIYILILMLVIFCVVILPVAALIKYVFTE